MTFLKIQNISLNVPQMSRPVLSQINYDVQRGDFVILLGSNGSGKSSLLKLLYRQYQADNGGITFLNRPLHSYSGAEFAGKVAVLTQNCGDSLFSSLTVYENYLMIKKQGGDRKYFQDYVSDFNPRLADKLDSSVEQLSGGEKQALALALCLLHPPELLLLDEHTSALDPKTSAQIMRLTQEMIRRHGMTCVLTTHNLSIAREYGNRILMLREGHIIRALNKGSVIPSHEELAEFY